MAAPEGGIVSVRRAGIGAVWFRFYGIILNRGFVVMVLSNES